MDVTIRIEGLDQLTEAIAMLGGAMAYFKGASAEEAVASVNEVTAKAEESISKAEENSTKEEKLPQATVPTGQAAYSFEQIQLACAKASQAGKRNELQGLINGFGLNSLLELKEEQYNDFVLKLREIGGTI
ncbi:hypothetical protein [Aedoeadaptatus coxii]|uniref:hypothetical protein n=1 Tax=Aedoeadaptatus coxii TaxID=755172 RepID=UPI002AD48009|nr:hypothetical protein [Peptoniphilus coxii]